MRTLRRSFPAVAWLLLLTLPLAFAGGIGGAGGAADLSTATGTLPVANGGTGLTSGTSGGVLCYTASGTIASSGALAANSLVKGGGAGVAPSTITTGTGIITALGVNVGSAGAPVLFNGALGTPSSGTLTNATGLPINTGLVIASEAQGDIIYRGASNWTRLGAGTSGYVLTSGGAGANPAWAAASGGSSKYRIVWTPPDNEPPSANYATPSLRNGHPVLEFDTSTQEAAIFSNVISTSYGGGDFTCAVYWAAASATSGTGGWDVTLERVGTAQDIDSDGWATAKTVTAQTVPGTSGFIYKSTVTLTAGATDTDSIAAGEAFRIRLRRDVANDNAAGDLQMIALELLEN